MFGCALQTHTCACVLSSHYVVQTLEALSDDPLPCPRSYFAYLSILHLYETLGFWRAGAELRKIHFAEEWNELHHLQIMESLGGDQVGPRVCVCVCEGALPPG